MTSVNGLPQSVSTSIQQNKPTLAVGQRVQAHVVGATRHGVSVQIGRETFQLDVPARMADARTLTLEGAKPASTSAPGQRVKIVALDDRLLARPVTADLTTRPQTVSPTSSAIVQTSRIEVIAQPVSVEGRAIGPSVALHLRAQIGGLASDATPDAVPTKAEAAQSAMSPASLRGPVPAGQQVWVGQSGVDVTQGKVTGGMVPNTSPSTDGPAFRGAPPASAIMTSNSAQSVSLEQPAGAAPKEAAAAVVLNQAKGIHPSMQASEGTRPASPHAIASASLTYRSGSEEKPGSQSTTSAQAPPRTDPFSSLDRSNPISATVIERRSDGRVLLKAADQLLRIEQPIDLPVGSTLQATLAMQGAPSPNALEQRPQGDPATALTRLIDLLDDIDRAGRQTVEPGIQMPAKQLPQPDKHLASRFLGLLAGDGGQSSAGEAASSPDRQGIATNQREQIQSMVRDLGAMASEQLAEGWKSQTLPLGSDQAQAVCFYFRDQTLDPDEESSEEEVERKDIQRAVFDVSFSRLGRCQIDAFCQDQRFDLLIRSEEPLPRPDQEAVAALFASASEIGGFKGEIGFSIGGFFEPPRMSTVARDVRS